MPTYRSACPRHCYGTCGIIAHINGNKLTRVLGDPDHGYTQGRLCAKGYALVQYSLDQNRLKYPMKQILRGSNQWKRISWEEAYTTIAEKILELHHRFGSNLGIGYTLGKGNTGFIHQAVKALFASLGPHTKPAGDICSGTGNRALLQVADEIPSPDPEDMVKAGLIVLWGANPAVTNINQMKFIYEAQQNGASFVVIDPIFTQSAHRANLYVQINPGTDALLAWGIARMVIEKNGQNHNFVEYKTIGWENYQAEIRKLDLSEVVRRTGVQLSIIEELADLYVKLRPVINWLGFGCQRNPLGEQTVKAVSSLTALTGGYGTPGGGLYFRNRDIEDFPQLLRNYPEKKHPIASASREIAADDYAAQTLQLSDPPLKLLWISCANPLAQDHNISAWKSLFSQLELSITVDLYLTRTAQQSDLILPAASFFEEQDLHISFWNRWLTINQKVLPAFFETKSDLQIARELVRKLNTLEPGFTDFPEENEPWEWIEGEFTSHIKALYDIDHPALLLKHPVKRKSEEIPVTWKYHFALPRYDVFRSSELQGHPKAAQGLKVLAQEHPYTLLTPQSLLKFHSQYETLDWLNSEQDPVIEIAIGIAKEHQICEGSQIEIFNENAVLCGVAKINQQLPKNIIVAEQSGKYPVNDLIGQEEINLFSPSCASINFFHCQVNIRRANKYV